MFYIKVPLVREQRIPWKKTINIVQKVSNVVRENQFKDVLVHTNLTKHFKYKRVAELKIMSRKKEMFSAHY